MRATPRIMSAINAQAAIPGLHYFSDFISSAKQADLIQSIDASAWAPPQGNMKRRVQHHGWQYNYRARRVDASMYLGQLPAWLEKTITALYALQDDVGLRLFAVRPDQCIINEYKPGQGIGAHIDCDPCFGPTIASLSLQNHCLMTFSRPEEETKIVVRLEPRSLLVLTGEARNRWRHEIKGKTIQGERRLSATFRTVHISPY